MLDATGMRISELEALTWGDVDETEGRWRVSRATSKTRTARRVPVPHTIFAAVVELVPREDRDLDAQVFEGFGADRFRTALTRACKAAGIPAYSPHDLRHRRASLWHLAGVPPAEAASWLGHSAKEHLQDLRARRNRPDGDRLRGACRGQARAIGDTRVTRIGKENADLQGCPNPVWAFSACVAERIWLSYAVSSGRTVRGESREWKAAARCISSVASVSPVLACCRRSRELGGGRMPAPSSVLSA